MRSMRNKILVALLACSLLMLGGCKISGGGGGGNSNANKNWDTLKWDHDKWQ